MLTNKSIQEFEQAVEHDSAFDCEERLLTRKEAAKYIGFAEGTLAVWDCTKRYNLKPVKIGRSVRYRLSVLNAFLLERMRP